MMKVFSNYSIYIGVVIIFLSLIDLSFQYMRFHVHEDRLCPVNKIKRKIKLGKEEFSALIVKQSRLSDHALQWTQNFRCRFQVATSHSKEGIFAVIQLLNFRRNDTTDTCIDFIQFSRKDGSSSPKFCGQFNIASTMDNNFLSAVEQVTEGNAFIDDKGELDVEMFVSKEPLRSDENTDLSLVFTSYRRCADVLAKNENFKPCSNSRIRRDYCIYSGFFYDSHVNCPFPDCVDEGGCLRQVNDEKPSIGNRILIGSLSSLFIMFAIFIMCLWVCRTYRILCWSDTFANPSSTLGPRPGQWVIELNEQPIPENPASQGHSASAPSTEEDKDLPPSYDSLFPQR